MKQIICILLVATMASISCLNMQGQEESQKHEVGMRMTSLNNFGFIYKKHRFDNKYLRFKVGNLSFLNQVVQPTTPQQTILGNRSSFNGSIGFSLGWENRKEITNELWFNHGFEPSIVFVYRLEELGNENRTSLSMTPNLGYVLGLQYDLSEKLYVGIETVPRYYFTYQISNVGTTNEDIIIRNGLFFTLNAVALNVVYRFFK